MKKRKRMKTRNIMALPMNCKKNVLIVIISLFLKAERAEVVYVQLL